MNRSQAREQAFILIFEKEFNREQSISDLIKYASEADIFETDEYAKRLSYSCEKNLEEIDSTISSCLKKWKLGRISKISLAILRISCCEILYFEDIPLGVSINEAVELGKKFGNENDPSFINGLLSSIKDLNGLNRKNTDNG